MIQPAMAVAGLFLHLVSFEKDSGQMALYRPPIYIYFLDFIADCKKAWQPLPSKVRWMKMSHVTLGSEPANGVTTLQGAVTHIFKSHPLRTKHPSSLQNYTDKIMQNKNEYMFFM